MFKSLSKLPCCGTKVLPWVILVFAALNVIFLGGKRRAFGGFIAQLHKEFSNITLTELNWVGDSYSALGYMSSSLSTAILLYFGRRYGLFQFIGALFVLLSCLTSSVVPNPHWLFLTHTLFHGIGSSLVISVVGLIVNEHFDKKHPYHLLATTLVSGGSVASILFVTFFAYIIEHYNWRMAFIILGGVYFFVNASASFFFFKNDDIIEFDNKKSMLCSCKGVQKRQIPLLILWFCERVLTSVVTYGLILNLTDYEHRTKKNLVSSTILTTLLATGEAITYLIGAIITAVTKDFFKEKLRYVLLCTSLLMSISLVALELTIHVYVATEILCFVVGFTLGPSIMFLFPAGEELTRLPGHIAYPFTLSGMGTGMMISPLLTAKIAELLSYKWFFMVQGGLFFLKSLCLFIIILLLYFYNVNDQKNGALNSGSSGDEIEVKAETPNERTELIPENHKK